jgi:hypothetical protein
MPDGSWAENIRTRACMMGIESLLAGLAWATILDCRAILALKIGTIKHGIPPFSS